MISPDGYLHIKALAEALKVSEMTIHRDLDFLQGEKLIQKKRGAAVFIENSYRNCSDFYLKEKREIGKKAASLLFQGQSVIFDNSTTAINRNHILYCSGGYYFPDSSGFIGKQAEDFVSHIKADVAIVGASGISLENGITNPYPMHNILQNKIIHSAKRCILVADHSKFDRTAMEKTAELSDIDMIITDLGISEELLEKYRKHIEIITV